MTLWRLEWLRLFRTRKWMILAGVYGFFGVLGPLTARYLAEIMDAVGGGVEMELPELTPADGITQYIGNAQQLGLLAVAFVAAGALAFDANREMSIFLRTRAKVAAIFTPRFIVNAAAAVAGFTFGAIIAYVGTGILLEWLAIGPFLLGVALHGVYLIFVVAVIAVLSSVFRSVLAVALTTLGVMILVAIVAVIPQLAAWLPSELVGAIDTLIRDGGFDYWRSLIVTVAAIPVLSYIAVQRFAAREV
jgi:ABC-2 type transport system permease protein